MTLRVGVVGGGVAGLATAWWLARRGHRVTLVEREAGPGVHASGRNAGLVRHVVTDPAALELGRRGAALLFDPPPDLAPAPLARRTGSVLLAGSREAPALLRAAADARAAGVAVDVREASGEAPHGVAPAPGMVAVSTPGDGLARPEAVVEALLRACARAGVDARLGREARVVTAAGQVAGLAAGDDEVACDVVVDAAGPWASALAERAGGAALPLASLRRHLFVATGRPPAPAPWVWDTERGLYARPWTLTGAGDAPALLLCACDEDPRPPEDALVEPDARARLAATLQRAAPGLLDLEVRLAWAGLRTFAPDRRFVVGWDPRLAGLFWVAALGGHGLTSALAVGDLAARAVEGQAGDDAALLAGLSPARLVATPCPAGAP
ncbi:MAG: FAD-binding oxidoreductase [Planctomycetes bacterium]|nr:FAD-binding oxidoreductase [Planctomycetota bacterium]